MYTSTWATLYTEAAASRCRDRSPARRDLMNGARCSEHRLTEANVVESLQDLSPYFIVTGVSKTSPGVAHKTSDAMQHFLGEFNWIPGPRLGWRINWFAGTRMQLSRSRICKITSRINVVVRAEDSRGDIVMRTISIHGLSLCIATQSALLFRI